jgi:hypothetical protein
MFMDFGQSTGKGFEIKYDWRYFYKCIIGNIFLFLFGCGPFHNCHEEENPATCIYLNY